MLEHWERRSFSVRTPILSVRTPGTTILSVRTSGTTILSWYRVLGLAVDVIILF